MSAQYVIARASGGEPLLRTVMAIGPKLVYLAHPAKIDSVLEGDTDPVGFPAEDVRQPAR